jgi:protocatechuate 3,4-dioxygenase, alpha subunit
MAGKFGAFRETPSQTAGPFVHIGLAPGTAGLDIAPRELGRVIAGPQCKGARIRVEGRVLDGKGAPVTDVLIEVWQADAEGRYNSADETGAPQTEPDFSGWGRVIPDFETGVFCFDTIKPGPAGNSQAPHLNLWLVARGINLGLNTRMYFDDDFAAHATDPVLSGIDDAARRQSLIARRDNTGAMPVYRFDIHLQGASETVFFDI